MAVLCGTQFAAQSDLGTAKWYRIDRLRKRTERHSRLGYDPVPMPALTGEDADQRAITEASMLPGHKLEFRSVGGVQRPLIRKVAVTISEVHGRSDRSKQSFQFAAQTASVGSIDDASHSGDRESIPVDARGRIAGVKPADDTIEASERVQVGDSPRVYRSR
jgi:hypothetical protein